MTKLSRVLHRLSDSLASLLGFRNQITSVVIGLKLPCIQTTLKGCNMKVLLVLAVLASKCVCTDQMVCC